MGEIYNKYIVIIPAYNPEMILINMVHELTNVGFKKIVDDGSIQGNDVFEKLVGILKVEVLKHFVNMGKGRALKTAINYVLNVCEECKGIITADADGQHKTEDIQACEKVLEEFIANRVMVLGCGCFEENEQVKIPFRSKLGNVCTRLVLR